MSVHTRYFHNYIHLADAFGLGDRPGAGVLGSNRLVPTPYCDRELSAGIKREHMSRPRSLDMREASALLKITSIGYWRAYHSISRFTPELIPALG
jgi:hypothetical protein